MRRKIRRMHDGFKDKERNQNRTMILKRVHRIVVLLVRPKPLIHQPSEFTARRSNSSANGITLSFVFATKRAIGKYCPHTSFTNSRPPLTTMCRKNLHHIKTLRTPAKSAEELRDAIEVRELP